MPSREKVRAFYERHPYPPPVDGLDEVSPRLAGPAAAPRRLPPALARAPYRGDHSILIAGCGTSQAAKHAMRWPRGAGDRHRLQRDQRAPHRGAQAEIRARQSRGPPARRRAGARAGRDVRSDRLHRRPPSSRRSRCGPGGAARRARARRGDAPHGLRALRADRHLHAAGVLPAARHRGHRRGIRELVAALEALPPGHPLAHAAARGARLPGTRRRSPMRCCTRRIAPTRCRSCSSCSTARGLRSGAGCARRPTAPAAASWRASADGARARIAALRPATSTPPSSCFGGRWSGTA